ncbi:hypothetical protein [Leucobacter sp. M11]|uniref:hypothetical protein n=1 Tax=Leucobacter sp. M11 TaxID=2993565 RepID=UPI002D7F846F|nr:hypothetical protein [Leucobacter sp. M11]MEB4615888.1 hypothetical protein [Leucobacter sp. M11]
MTWETGSFLLAAASVVIGLALQVFGTRKLFAQVPHRRLRWTGTPVSGSGPAPSGSGASFPVTLLIGIMLLGSGAILLAADRALPVSAAIAIYLAVVLATWTLQVLRHNRRVARAGAAPEEAAM